MLNSFAIATVLPAAFHHKKLNVYLQIRAGDEFYNLCTLVHEGYHVLQYQELHRRYRGLEWGFCRAFMWHYIGAYFSGLLHFGLQKKMPFAKASYAAYRYHPLEIDAYEQEKRFAAKETDFYAHSNTADFLYFNSGLCVHRSGYERQSPYFWAGALGFMFCLLILIIRPLVELVLLVSLYPIILMIGKNKNASKPD